MQTFFGAVFIHGSFEHDARLDPESVRTSVHCVGKPIAPSLRQAPRGRGDLLSQPLDVARVEGLLRAALGRDGGRSMVWRFDAPAARQRLTKLGFESDAPALPWRERLRILRDACRGLVYLHTPSGVKGVELHNDIKPL